MVGMIHLAWSASHLESEKANITKEQQEALDQLIKSLEVLRSNPESMKLVEEWFNNETKKSEEELASIDKEITALQKQLEDLAAKKIEMQQKLKTLQSGEKLISRLNGNVPTEPKPAEAAEVAKEVPANPAPPTAEKNNAALIFDRDIAEIVEVHCIACHGATNPGGELNMLTRESILKGGKIGKVIAAGNPKESLLYKMVTHEAEPYMPLGAEKLSNEDLEKIAAWILAEE
jgi:mono/diheme cytochrome c family protein